MYSSSMPRPLDFFPKTRRGHGSTHPQARFDKQGQQTRAAHACDVSTCVLNSRTGKGEAHIDQQANVGDWREEHGVSKHTPIEMAHVRR